jgi:hypothetical protein
VLKDNAAITTYMEARFLEPPKKADIQWLGAASPAPLFPTYSLPRTKAAPEIAVSH